MQFITKTIYLRFATCAKNAWLQLNKPELRDMFELSDFDKSLVAKGNMVEEYARKLFPRGVLISEFGEDACKSTVKFLKEKNNVIFQSTFISGCFLARNDVLEYDRDNDCWNLYEIKGTNTLNENENAVDHIEDASFQLAVLSDNKIKIGKIYIIHLNKDYVRGDEIAVNDLFIEDDVTNSVKERLESIREKMKMSVEILLQKDEGAIECQCLYLGRSNHCSTFSYSHPEVPEYSVHDLSRIGNSKKKLAALIDSLIFDINEILDPSIFSPIQQNQISVHKSKVPMIDLHSIRQELESLQYPLYFLDYETYPPAIPLFKGFKPYQQIPFQFSLHVLKSPEAELEHFEYLHVEASDPSEQVIDKLKQFIGPEGNIIVWSKKFEKSRNSELAERHSEDAGFLNGLNERIYDLMDIFQKQLYVHHGFRGKVSIKNILPVLVPELSYKDLEIQKGDMAMEAWYNMIFGDKTVMEKQSTAENLLKYCCLDTYAMYAIWKSLIKII